MKPNTSLLDLFLETQILDRVPRSGYFLRGVPEVADSAAGALQAYRQLRDAGERGPDFLLEGLALACRQDQRDDAAKWLEEWSAATSQQRARAPAFTDQSAPLQPSQLRELLPPQ